MFELGASYTREEIHNLVGGSLQSYLPHVGGRVVAACLRPDINPDAPAVIVAGVGEDIEYAAELLAAQRVPLPVFLKRGSGRWGYAREFVTERSSRDPAEVTAQARRSGRNDITVVIHMAPASSLAGGRG
jgi:hypothetical protein